MEPEKPNLYDLTIELLVENAVVDSAKTYFGMRKIEARGGNRIFFEQQTLLPADGVRPGGVLA